MTYIFYVFFVKWIGGLDVTFEVALRVGIENNQIATIGLDQLFYFANFLAFCGLKGEKGFIFLWRWAIKLMCALCAPCGL